VDLAARRTVSFAGGGEWSRSRAIDRTRGLKRVRSHGVGTVVVMVVVVVVVVVVVICRICRRRSGEVWSNAIAGSAVEDLSIHLHHKLVRLFSPRSLAGCWLMSLGLGWLAWSGLTCFLGGRRLNSTLRMTEGLQPQQQQQNHLQFAQQARRTTINSSSKPVDHQRQRQIPQSSPKQGPYRKGINISSFRPHTQTCNSFYSCDSPLPEFHPSICVSRGVRCGRSGAFAFHQPRSV
jgi:hypothetical protein